MKYLLIFLTLCIPDKSLSSSDGQTESFFNFESSTLGEKITFMVDRSRICTVSDLLLTGHT